MDAADSAFTNRQWVAGHDCWASTLIQSGFAIGDDRSRGSSGFEAALLSPLLAIDRIDQLSLGAPHPPLPQLLLF